MNARNHGSDGPIEGAVSGVPSQEALEAIDALTVEISSETREIHRVVADIVYEAHRAALEGPAEGRYADLANVQGISLGRINNDPSQHTLQIHVKDSETTVSRVRDLLISALGPDVARSHPWL